MSELKEIEVQSIEVAQNPKKDIYTRVFSASGKEEKKDILKDLSKTAKTAISLNPDLTESTVNGFILNLMYKNEVHTEFNTFKGWKEKGFKVSKGSKAFFIWSKPKKASKTVETENEGETKEKEYKFFGIANLFSNAQVEPIN